VRTRGCTPGVDRRPLCGRRALHPAPWRGDRGRWFRVSRRTQGEWVKIEQLGAVRIGNDVEIGANTCIDRGALDDTVIEDGVKLDNLIQIGHNVRIGRTRPWRVASAWRAAPPSARTAPSVAAPSCWAT
jgi:hypothetical protein